MRHILFLALFTAACGSKDKTSTAAPVEAADPTAGMDVPDDSASKKFATALVEMEITDFKPSDTSGATFKYNTLSFEADNSWAAAGFVEMGGETMECTESGKWSMDPAVSATEADMVWTLDQTDCAGRDAGGETRVNVTLTKTGWDVAFR